MSFTWTAATLAGFLSILLRLLGGLCGYCRLFLYGLFCRFALLDGSILLIALVRLLGFTACAAGFFLACGLLSGLLCLYRLAFGWLLYSWRILLGALLSCFTGSGC